MRNVTNSYMPEISVIMPVYNAGKFLAAAIESVLKQNYTDFEFIILDDASTDNSLEIISKVCDPRIVLIANEENLGVARSLNKGIELARGRYIARMDADDISMPNRLARQVRFMQDHPEIGISGGWVQMFGNGPPSIARVPSDPEEIAAYMLFETPMWHVTVIMRRDLIIRHKLRYNPKFSRSEDYDLWTRAIVHFPLANLNEILVRVREHGGSATRANWDEMTKQTEIILGRLLEQSGFSVSVEDIAFHHRVGRGYRMNSKKEIEKAEKWLQNLIELNLQKQTFTDVYLRRAVAKVWFRVCSNSGPLGFWIFRKWIGSPLRHLTLPPTVNFVRFLASIIWHRCRQALA